MHLRYFKWVDVAVLSQKGGLSLLCAAGRESNSISAVDEVSGPVHAVRIVCEEVMRWM